jgi:C4-dicarboxylate-specific signal transduction histidine kinase
LIRKISIELKIIISIILFTVVVVSVDRYQFSNTTLQQFIKSQKSKNDLLINTIMPIIALNISLGLESANQEYLEQIVKQNDDLEFFKLEDSSQNLIYSYEKESAINSSDKLNNLSTYNKPIVDYLSNEKIGFIHLRFSNKELEEVNEKNRETTFSIFLMTFVLLILFISLIKIEFKDLKKLNRYLLKYDPKLNNLTLTLSPREDEVGVIHNTIKSMVEKINSHAQDLDELNHSLEQKVEERTKELIQKDKILTAQSKQAVMGEMIQMIAHQWRQPLSTITLQISNLEIAKMLGNVIDKQKEEETLRQISDTIIYLSDTIDDFQTYFNPEKETTRIEIHELLQKAVNFALPRIKSQNIELKIKKEQDIYVNVYINELVQVVLNLVNNAIDAFADLQRDNKYVHLHVEEEGKLLRIYVTDNGCGILEENITKLFEPYFSTKGKNGTGLGLYMSQKIIEKQFDGRIDVESSPEGTSFIITIKK